MGSAAIRATRGLRYSRDSLDRAALARRIAALEEHQDASSGLARPLLKLHELGLQPKISASYTLLEIFGGFFCFFAMG